MGKVNLFVYGSMKKNFINHERILKGEASFISEATTVDFFSMFPDSQYMFPYMIENQKENYIRGELYNLSEDYIEDIIDVMEGCPQYYYRKKILVHDKYNRVHEAYVYFLNPLNKDINYDDGFQINEWTIDHESKGLKLQNFYHIF